jgi:Dolichyl-phosphate-mannose-protein mannosyltransferase
VPVVRRAQRGHGVPRACLNRRVVLAPGQLAFLDVVREVCRERRSDRFTVLSEWDGLLPFAMSIRVEDVPAARFPHRWDSGDLEALVAAGRLEELERQVDGEDTRLVYRLRAEAPGPPAPRPSPGPERGGAATDAEAFALPRRERRLEQLGLALLTFGAIFAFASIPADDYDGSLYVVVARHLVEDGTPFALRGLPGAFAHFTEHPPMFFWLLAGAIRVGGEACLPWLMGCFGAATVLLAFAWARRRLGAEAAWLGCVLLVLTESFSRYQARARIDPLVILCFTASVLALFEARGRLRWWLVGGLAAGLGSLFKGPPALGAPVLAAGLVALDGRGKELLRPRALAVVAACALAPLALFFAGDAVWLDSTWWRGYVQHQVMASVTGARLEGHTERLYLFGSLVGRSPVAFALALVALVARRWRRDWPPEQRVRLALTAWVLFIPAAYSLAARAVWHYNSPAYVPLALLGGVGAFDLLRWLDATGRVRWWLRRTVLVLGGAAALAVPLGLASLAQTPHRFGPLSARVAELVPAGGAVLLVDPRTDGDLGDQIYLTHRGHREVVKVTPAELAAALAPGAAPLRVFDRVQPWPTVALFRGADLVAPPFQVLARHGEWALASRPEP